MRRANIYSDIELSYSLAADFLSRVGEAFVWFYWYSDKLSYDLIVSWVGVLNLKISFGSFTVCGRMMDFICEIVRRPTGSVVVTVLCDTAQRYERKVVQGVGIEPASSDGQMFDEEYLKSQGLPPRPLAEHSIDDKVRVGRLLIINCEPNIYACLDFQDDCFRFWDYRL